MGTRRGSQKPQSANAEEEEEDEGALTKLVQAYTCAPTHPHSRTKRVCMRTSIWVHAPQSGNVTWTGQSITNLFSALRLPCLISHKAP